MELTERKKKVLRSVVDLYIRTAEPVGSKAIADELICSNEDHAVAYVLNHYF